MELLFLIAIGIAGGTLLIIFLEWKKRQKSILKTVMADLRSTWGYDGIDILKYATKYASTLPPFQSGVHHRTLINDQSSFVTEIFLKQLKSVFDLTPIGSYGSHRSDDEGRSKNIDYAFSGTYRSRGVVWPVIITISGSYVDVDSFEKDMTRYADGQGNIAMARTVNVLYNIPDPEVKDNIILDLMAASVVPFKKVPPPVERAKIFSLFKSQDGNYNLMPFYTDKLYRYAIADFQKEFSPAEIKIAQRYFKIGMDKVVDLSESMLQDGQNILLLGIPGTGKSAIMHAIIHRLHEEMNVVIIPPTVFDDLGGAFTHLLTSIAANQTGKKLLFVIDEADPLLRSKDGEKNTLQAIFMQLSSGVLKEVTEISLLMAANLQPEQILPGMLREKRMGLVVNVLPIKPDQLESVIASIQQRMPEDMTLDLESMKKLMAAGSDIPLAAVYDLWRPVSESQIIARVLDEYTSLVEEDAQKIHGFTTTAAQGVVKPSIDLMPPIEVPLDSATLQKESSGSIKGKFHPKKKKR
jgi:hypothetical protein